MKCFYHDDADGHCAGFWVHLSAGITDKYQSNEFIPINYHIPFPIESIKKDEQVWIVDYSISIDEMDKLLDITENVVWIDHHISSIEKYKDYPRKIKGLRYDGISGCELTYCYLHLMNTRRGEAEENMIPFEESMIKEAPMFTQYIGDRDVWKFDLGDNYKYFHEDYLLEGEPHPDSNWWYDLLSDKTNIGDNLFRGNQAVHHSAMLNKKAVNQWGYEAEFEGHTIFACNSTVRSSELFGELIKDYPFVSAYTHDGNGFSVSLYSVNMDVNHLAEKYNGGGHRRACGFQCSELPFVKVTK
jgi:oligoribonuclease NrnB/cAMP/cGMP phosphodiesterase (DHH superfamily)